MPPLSSQDVDDEFLVQHHLVHLNSEHHHKTLMESINSLLHSGGTNNGSHSGNGIDLTTDEVSEISEDIIIVLFTLVPLIITVALIFLIAVAIRKMRRSESLQEVARNEFKMMPQKGIHNKHLGLRPSFSNPLDSFKSLARKSKKTNPPSPLSLHEIRVVSAPRNHVKLGTQLSLESSSSTNSNCSHHNNITNPSPNFPWYLHSTSYYRSQYHMNKLNRQLYYNNMSGSLQSFGSMQSLPQYTNDQYSSTGALSCGISQSIMNVATFSESEVTSTSFEKKSQKSSSKKLKKVFQMMNFPKRIKQHHAEKNRFNVYTIPNETREQLKQIYVY